MKKRTRVLRPSDRVQDLYDAFIADLGGEDATSEAQRQLAQRASALCVVCERHEAAATEGAEPATESYVRAANTLRRILVSLGLEPRSRHDVPSLDVYLKNQYSRKGEGRP